MKAFALAWRLLLRDWKSGELTVLVLALTIAVTSLTAVAFLTDRVGHAVELRAAESLAADLRLGSSQPLPESYIEKADQAGLQTAAMITMPHESILSIFLLLYFTSTKCLVLSVLIILIDFASFIS